jgi:hypothetical protein
MLKQTEKVAAERVFIGKDILPNGMSRSTVAKDIRCFRLGG